MSQPKKLYRLPKQGMIAGVIAGIADYLELDPTLLRLIFVVLIFATGGFVIVLYVIFALVLPTPESKHVTSAAVVGDSLSRNATELSREIQENGGISRARNLIGGALILLGVWLLLSQLFPELLDFRWDVIWPALLVVFGLLVVTKGRK